MLHGCATTTKVVCYTHYTCKHVHTLCGEALCLRLAHT
nr:MAG TPA: hypothetical protein [Caudoviricetes sp.]